MTSSWRLLVHDAVDGRLNMAIDRAIQLSREQAAVPPTLRLYRWSRPTVSMGRFQKHESVAFGQCQRLGIDVVRRSTGGRGVLHDDELTYSVIASRTDGIPRQTAAAYAHVSGGLIAAYRTLGIEAQLTHKDRGSKSAGACYLLSTRADVTVGGAKLAGSAQVWLGSTVLQHGSITRTRDVEREAAVFMLDDAQVQQLAEETCTLDASLGYRLSLSSIIEAAVGGFASALGVRLVPGELSAYEAELVRRLLSDPTPG